MYDRREILRFLAWAESESLLEIFTDDPVAYEYIASLYEDYIGVYPVDAREAW